MLQCIKRLYHETVSKKEDKDLCRRYAEDKDLYKQDMTKIRSEIRR